MHMLKRLDILVPPPQHGQRLKVTWCCGRPAGVAFVAMRNPMDVRVLLSQLAKEGHSRNMISFGSGMKVFVSASRTSDK